MTNKIRFSQQLGKRLTELEAAPIVDALTTIRNCHHKFTSFEFTTVMYSKQNFMEVGRDCSYVISLTGELGQLNPVSVNELAYGYTIRHFQRVAVGDYFAVVSHRGGVSLTVTKVIADDDLHADSVNWWAE